MRLLFCKSVFVFALLCWCTASICWAQPDTTVFPKIIFEHDHWEEMIPAGWQVVQQTAADFNDDKTIDLVCVIEPKQPMQWQDEKGKNVSGYPRILVMIMKQRPKGFYRLIEQANTFIPARITGRPDALKTVKFSRTYLTIEMVNEQASNAARLVKSTYLFHFELARFYLLQAIHSDENFKDQTYTIHEFNFPSWRVARREGNEEEGDILVQSKLMNRQMLKHFGHLQQAFQWKVWNEVML